MTQGSTLCSTKRDDEGMCTKEHSVDLYETNSILGRHNRNNDRVLLERQNRNNDQVLLETSRIHADL